MGLSLDVTIPAITVFLQGILSFFSPCVLPIIPLYVGYLSGGTMTVGEDGQRRYNQKNVIINTLFFIIGVSFAFFLLGLGFSALGQFFTSNQMIFSRVGGIIVILLGCMQIGIFSKPFGEKEFKLPIKANVLRMSPITALVMGFTFSFAWTPCVGPALSTVLIMISSASSSSYGIMLMGVYTLGFTLPFLLVGIFTTKCLDLFKKHRNVVAYTVKIGAVLMILMGIMMFTGVMNGITGYLSSIGADSSAPQTQQEYTEDAEQETTEIAGDDEAAQEDAQQEAASETETFAAIDFELLDQYGNTHTLSDYKGKVIFLNFWATWCGYCVQEMPDIQTLYEEYGYNEEDVAVLGVAMPNDENIYTQEQSLEYVTNFLSEQGFTYPTLMDMTGELAASYGISSYPITFMIDADGNLFGYVPGMLTYDIMCDIVEQTKAQEIK